MSDGKEVKRAIYMSTGVSRRKNYDMIINLVERLLPNGEIKVTTPELQELERIVAELRSDVAQAKREAADAMSGCCDCPMFKAKGKTIARQAKVIEKLKLQRGTILHEKYAGFPLLAMNAESDLDKELEAIEQGEGT